MRDYDRFHAWERSTLRGWPAIRVLLTVVLLAFAAYSLVRGGEAYHEATVLRDERVLAAGQVEKTVRSKSGDHANVRFTTRDGRAVHAEVTAWKDFPDRGDHVAVCYAPRNPGRYAQDARVCPDFSLPRFAIIMGIASLFVLAIAWSPPLLRRALRRKP